MLRRFIPHVLFLTIPALFALSCTKTENSCVNPSLVQDGTSDGQGESDLLSDGSLDFFSGDTKDSLVPDFALADGVETASLCDGEPPYPFGCSCEGNTQCESGYCVESIFGFVCTQECLEECAEGWFCRGISGFGSDLVFVCMPESKKLCYPCEQDSQCGGGRCVEMDDGRYCTYECDGTEATLCTASFQCESVTLGEEETQLCMPTSGSCSCTTSTEGTMQTCQVTNELGTCYGFEHCDSTLGWVECSALPPSIEVCDGLDNDCNGSIDEGLPESQDCSKEGEDGAVCQGKAFCYGSQGWVCTAADPAEEICDYKDNNCDGVVDELFTDEHGKYVDFDNCGSCNVTCSIGFPNALTKCDATRNPPQCVVDQCSPGYFKLNDFQCVPTFSQLCESCNTDDNCLDVGARCVQLNDGKFCSKACSVDSECPSGYGCLDYEGELLCIPLTNSCTCDGTNTLLSRSCIASWPTMPAPGETVITCYGIQDCTQDGWSGCNLPYDECDGVDNDCNGTVDDDWIVDDKYIDNENCGECGNNCTFLSFANGYGACDASLSVPQCAMFCNDGFLDVNGNPTDGCECHPEAGEDVPDGVDSNCDGVDGDVSKGVFVAKNGSDSNPGTREAPMFTISSAIDLAEAQNQRDVYVATGVYSESVTLTGGINVYGGYSSDFKIRDSVLYETVIMGSTPTTERPGAVNAIDLRQAAPTMLAGFSIFGHDNDDSGGSSYAVYIRNSDSSLTVTGNRLFSGNGGNGAPGTAGTDGASGTPGQDGNDAFGYTSYQCSPTPALASGGPGGLQTCSGSVVSGGNGGSNYCPDYDETPNVGANGQDGSGTLGGDGGAAGWDGRLSFACDACTIPGSVDEPRNMDGLPGLDGQNGQPGQAGAKCEQSDGTVAGGLWVAAQGGNALAASAGSGGGGGGAGGGADKTAGGFSCNDQVGGSGGGGGSGGCPGGLGTGGTGGGGSFGAFVVIDITINSYPSVIANVIYGGYGGNGGAGGNGGVGGAAGAGGEGGSSGLSGTSAWCAQGGGTGGNGGRGGHGGGGGGGCGGASYCVFVYAPQSGGTIPNLDGTSNTCHLGVGGLGGAGGLSLDQSGPVGDEGVSGSLTIQ